MYPPSDACAAREERRRSRTKAADPPTTMADEAATSTQYHRSDVRLFFQLKQQRPSYTILKFGSFEIEK